MSESRSRRGRQKSKAVATPTKNAPRTGTKQGKPKSHPRKSPADARRPYWGADFADAELQAITSVVRPAPDPTALVRSLGSPPLGKFGDNAQHYYAVVFEKAQRFAIAMATASGVRIEEDGSDGGGDESEAEG